jgi:ABC-type dipeptide/oligopeptide/nickel transport system permease component
MSRGIEYLLKRVGFALITIFLVVTLNFALFRLAPGDAVDALGSCRNCTAQFKQALRADLGLDQSKLHQYFTYLGQLAHGDLGTSFQTRQPVWSVLAPRILDTLPMLALGLLFAIVVGVAAATLAVWRRGSAFDGAQMGVAMTFYSMPNQWLALIFVVLFAGVLPVSGASDPLLELTNPGWFAVLEDRLRHLLLPALTIGLVFYGQFALVTRSALLQTLGEDYILTARAKGLRSWTILRRYALRNAMLPVTTLIALSVGSMLAGMILVETVFSYPGIGRATYQAAVGRDYPVLQGAFLVLTIGVVLANLVADLVYFKLDPRIKA